jgi:L-alanine-DL-glutamate epimerase-like enolase superfamily enzyme
MRAEVHGGGVVNRHLCMAIANTTYYESLVYSNPVHREPAVGEDGHVQAPTQPGIGYETA